MCGKNEQPKNTEPLASEMYADLKRHAFFLKILVGVLLAALIGTNVYHIYQGWTGPVKSTLPAHLLTVMLTITKFLSYFFKPFLGC